MCPRVCIKIVLSLSTIGFVASFTSDDLRITLSNGNKLVGKYLRSFSGKPIKAFVGIPYAKPPIGQLRFKVSWFQITKLCYLSVDSFMMESWYKAPEPIGKWDGEYEAIFSQPRCSQLDINRPTYVVDKGTEDCLQLSVYVPHRVT